MRREVKEFFLVLPPAFALNPLARMSHSPLWETNAGLHRWD